MRGGRWIVRNVSWSVPAGTLAAILGPNGSGKSTLARIIAAHLWPTSGQCEILGGQFGKANLPQLRHRIRLVQPAGPYDVDPSLTAREVVLTGFFASIALYDQPSEPMKQEAGRVMALLGLSAVADSPYELLSSGEKMRSLIARAMVTRPRLLILDEPTAGLDLLAREQVLATIGRLHGPTVILITHHVEELPPTTSGVLLMRDGKSAASGTMVDVLTAPNLSRAYGVDVEVRRANGRYYPQVHPSAWEGLLGDSGADNRNTP
jgi:iron complex transport system ATP-binding protein